MSAITDFIKKATTNVKIDNDGLDLLRVNLRKDATKSRAVLRITSEIGIDLPGDAAEDALILVANAFLPKPSGND